MFKQFEYTTEKCQLTFIERIEKCVLECVSLDYIFFRGVNVRRGRNPWKINIRNDDSNK